MNFQKSLLTAMIAIALPVVAQAQSQAKPASGCEAYPYTHGINVETVNGGTKILSTATVSVSYDDIDSVHDSRDEAILEAKASISKFLNEDIKSEEKITKVVNETKSMAGDKKDGIRKETIDRVKKLSNSSQALLRGVVVLGECYTKGREVRVSVGIKPETIAQAGNLAGGISKSLSSNPTPSSASQLSGDRANPNSGANTEKSGTSKDLQNVEGYSNTKNLEKF